VVVRDQGMNMTPFVFWREEDLQRDFGIHQDDVTINPSIVMLSQWTLTETAYSHLHQPLQSLFFWQSQLCKQLVQDVCWL
jgi:hypothetical protein